MHRPPLSPALLLPPGLTKSQLSQTHPRLRQVNAAGACMRARQEHPGRQEARHSTTDQHMLQSHRSNAHAHMCSLHSMRALGHNGPLAVMALQPAAARAASNCKSTHHHDQPPPPQSHTHTHARTHARTHYPPPPPAAPIPTPAPELHPPEQNLFRADSKPIFCFFMR
jgi:hypothetical protein